MNILPHRALPEVRTIDVSPVRALPEVWTMNVPPRRRTPEARTVNVSPRRRTPEARTVNVSPRRRTPEARTVNVSPRKGPASPAATHPQAATAALPTMIPTAAAPANRMRSEPRPVRTTPTCQTSTRSSEPTRPPSQTRPATRTSPRPSSFDSQRSRGAWSLSAESPPPRRSPHGHRRRPGGRRARPRPRPRRCPRPAGRPPPSPSSSPSPRARRCPSRAACSRARTWRPGGRPGGSPSGRRRTSSESHRAPWRGPSCFWGRCSGTRCRSRSAVCFRGRRTGRAGRPARGASGDVRDAALPEGSSG